MSESRKKIVHNRTALKTFFILTLLSLFLILSNSLPIIRICKNVIMKILYPISVSIEYPGYKANSIYNRYKMLIDSYDKNIQLNQRVKELEMENASLHFFKNENKRINSILEFENVNTRDILPVKVITQLPESYFSEFIINKGLVDGIEEDQPVIAVINSKWILVGRIIEVLKNTSRVVLVTSSDFKCSVEINNDYGGVLKGNNDWVISLEYIAPDADISEGDSVYTSGKGGIFPPGIFVGNIVEVKNIEFSIGKTAVVKGFFYPQDIKYVYVLMDKE